jgi:hypothetical protein
METCLLSHPLAVAVYSGSTILALRWHSTMLYKVVQREDQFWVSSVDMTTLITWTNPCQSSPRMPCNIPWQWKCLAFFRT